LLKYYQRSIIFVLKVFLIICLRLLMKNIKYAIICLLSLTLISNEIIWTRIFSAEFFHPFAFLILSLAILGLGLGGLYLRLFDRDKKQQPGLWLSLSGLATLVTPLLVFALDMDFSKLLSEPSMILKLAASMLLLGSPYFAGGVALTAIFRTNSSDMPRVYMFDLLGAGVGVAASILCMNIAGTQAAAFFCAIPVIIAAFLANRKKGFIIPSIAVAVALFLIFYPGDLLENKREEKNPVIHKHWDAFAKIKVLDYHPLLKGVIIDNAASTTAIRYIPGSAENETMDIFEIDPSYLIGQFPSCNFLSLGAGAGKDVLFALQHGASEVHAVEVNPYINYMMTDGFLADFTGNIYKDSKVKVVTEDARTYIRGFRNKFDIIFSFSSTSYAALASGAFSFAENYIYTTEAFVDYLNALTDGGYLVMEHHFYIPRLVSSCIEAMKRLGITDYKSHIAVYDLPEFKRNILLVSKKPLTPEVIQNAIGGLGPDHHGNTIAYPLQAGAFPGLINDIIDNGWENVQNADIDLTPPGDDQPFIAQMGLWRNFSLTAITKLEPFEFFGFPLAKSIIWVIILVIVVLIIPLNFLPYRQKGLKLKAIPFLYFFAIGFGFMSIEVILISKYNLLLGTSLYSLIAVLFVILIASGFGSRFSGKVGDKLCFLLIVAFILLDAYLYKEIIYAAAALSLWLRLLITVVLIAPLSFFLGMAFPKGTARVGELVDWGFSVNGAASVLGSTFIMLIAFSYGFTVSLTIGAVVYAAAYFLLAAKGKW